MKALKFMPVAEAVARLSKDRSTKVGALAIGPGGEIRAMGYNGFPRGCNDDLEARHERPTKYLWAEHAERNLIYNAARAGTPLAGCMLVVTMFPCMDCARAIVQAGFIGVVTYPPDGQNERWATHFEAAQELFHEVGVPIYLVNKEVA